MRFRKRVKLFPGVHLNLSGSGISTTIGVPGASLSVGKRGTYLNTGIPGTGLYARTRLDGPGTSQLNAEATGSQTKPRPKPLSMPSNSEIIATENAEAVTTEGLKELKETLLECYTQRNDLRHELKSVEKQLSIASLLLLFSRILLIGFVLGWFRANRDAKQERVSEIKEDLTTCFVPIEISSEDGIGSAYAAVLEKYRTATTCSRIWDTTSTAAIDQAAERSAASATITREAVTFGLGSIDIIKSNCDVMHLENANGGDLYIYPGFVAVVDGEKSFGLIAIEDVELSYHPQRCIEKNSVPEDAKVVDHTWAKVNKNGKPDRRFKDNYKMPICQYGDLCLSSEGGLNEEYLFSSYAKAKPFADALLEYQDLVAA